MPAELIPCSCASLFEPNTRADSGLSHSIGCAVRHDASLARSAHHRNRREAVAEACLEQGCPSPSRLRTRGGRSSAGKQANHFRNALRPRSWRVRTRRAFVMSLPIALPIWLVYLLSLYVAELGAEATASLRPFWSAPPRSYGSYSRYFYGGRSKTKHRDRFERVPHTDQADEQSRSSRLGEREGG